MSILRKIVAIAMAASAFNTYCAQHTITLTPQTTLSIEQGDITHSKVSVIVNAAGQEKLQEACDKNPISNGVRCPTGQARITPSFNLERIGITHIIHAVGPDCRIVKDPAEQDRLLHQAYTQSLTLADTHKLPTIAFPFISSAIYAFPSERCAHVALQAIKEYAQKHKNSTQVKRIHCVLFSQKDLGIFLNALKS